MLLGLNVCNADEEARCKTEFGEHYEWACKNCEKKKRHDIHPWTGHLLTLRRLQNAGYPFGKNDLSFEEWTDLGLINEMLNK